jgi:hypothetical protein
VYTSNVDGLFARSGHPPATLFEIHGALHGPAAWFCPACSGDGRSGGGGGGDGSGGGGSEGSSSSSGSDDSGGALVPAKQHAHGAPFPVDPATLELHDHAAGGQESGEAPAAHAAEEGEGNFEEEREEEEALGAWPRCTQCGGRARPAVLMFGDNCQPLVRFSKKPCYITRRRPMTALLNAPAPSC